MAYPPFKEQQINPEKLRCLPPRRRLLHWINEREAIRLRREAGTPWPWTNDPILRSYRFCNVRRMDDRVSRWLLDNWYLPNRGHRNMLLACALARFVNRPESLAAVGFPKTWAPARVEHTLLALPGPVFNSAYIVSGSKGESKVTTVVWRNLGPLSPGHAPSPNTDSMEVTWALLRRLPGMGSFMAGQVVADLRWATEGSWDDRNSWAPLGPGSRRGINRLYGRDKDSPLPQRRFLEELMETTAWLRQSVDGTLADRLEAIDYQSCLCEFDKYERVLMDGRRCKRTYPAPGWEVVR